MPPAPKKRGAALPSANDANLHVHSSVWTAGPGEGSLAGNVAKKVTQGVKFQTSSLLAFEKLIADECQVFPVG
jgi:uncharacterized protein YhfF